MNKVRQLIDFAPPDPLPEANSRRSVCFPGMLMASLTSKIFRKNDYILFTDPLGADNDAIKPATIHITHAIRCLYAQSGPKVTSKETQSHLHMAKVIPK